MWTTKQAAANTNAKQYFITIHNSCEVLLKQQIWLFYAPFGTVILKTFIYNLLISSYDVIWRCCTCTLLLFIHLSQLPLTLNRNNLRAHTITFYMNIKGTVDNKFDFCARIELLERIYQTKTIHNNHNTVIFVRHRHAMKLLRVFTHSLSFTVHSLHLISFHNGITIK